MQLMSILHSIYANIAFNDHLVLHLFLRFYINLKKVHHHTQKCINNSKENTQVLRFIMKK